MPLETLAHTLHVYLQVNPGRCLNADDISDQFQHKRARVHTDLACAVAEGHIGRADQFGKASETVYFLPGGEFAKKNGLAAKPKAKGVAGASSVFGKSKRVHVDRKFSDIKIEDGVPLPTRHKTSTPQYQLVMNIFSKMKAGQSALFDFCPPVTQACRVFNKVEGQSVTRQMVGETQMRVWRVK